MDFRENFDKMPDEAREVIKAMIISLKKAMQREINQDALMESIENVHQEFKNRPAIHAIATIGEILEILSGEDEKDFIMNLQFLYAYHLMRTLAKEHMIKDQNKKGFDEVWGK